MKYQNYRHHFIWSIKHDLKFTAEIMIYVQQKSPIVRAYITEIYLVPARERDLVCVRDILSERNMVREILSARSQSEERDLTG